MTKKKILFGVGMFDAVELASGKHQDGTPLSQAEKAGLEDRIGKAAALFNYATLPFYWGRFEPVEGKPDTERLMAAAKWLAKQGVTVKGHPLCWHTVCAPWLMNYDDKTILDKQLERIHREVGAFRGVIDMWDVINETVIMPVFDKYDNAVTRICKRYGRETLIKEVFNAAHEANPDAVLLINDFNTSPAYEDVIQKSLDAGVPINVIGIQSHQHQGYWGVEKIRDVLKRFSRFGLPLHFTENTLLSGHLMPPEICDLNDYQVKEWPTTPEGEARQAQQVSEMYRTLLECPLVEAITNWDLTDGQWLGAPSGMLRSDNSIKPAYEAVKKIKDGL
jgi:GH35 family endo-1,4-beta-xylanase